MAARVLIVDDEPSILNILDIMLSREGFEVSLAPSGEEAIEILKETSYDFNLVITDVVMPKMNGYELGQHILAINEEMPILFISGFNSSKELTSLINQHRNLTYLPKPFGIEEIKNKMKEILPDQEITE